MKLIVLTDTGTFKAFRLDQDPWSSSARLEPVQAYETSLGDDRISRRLSDAEGQHGRGSVTSAVTSMGDNGERHNIWLENQRRSVKEIADTINGLLEDGEFESCYFAAGNEINHAVLEHLTPKARAKIEKNVHSNLVNAKREEVLNQFCV
jgi:hypothetical protein